MTKENLFVDTSVFVQENFLEGTRINTILDLSADGHIELFLSEITINEIKARFKKQATVAFDKHNEFIKDKRRTSQVHVLRNNPEGKSIIKRLPSLKTICGDFNTLFDNRLKSARAIILPYPVINISEVFDNYFSNKPPFGLGDKKHEFPDAFAFAHLEQWCTDNKCVAIFLTKDKDFSPKPNTCIEIINDHQKFIDDKMKAITEEGRLNRLNELYLLNSERIDKEITTWVEEQLENDGIFDDFTNWLEVDAQTINEVKVISKGYELIGGDDENLEIEIYAIVSYDVTLNIPDESTGVYDHEDGVMLFRENMDVQMKQNDLSLSLKLNFYIVTYEDFDADYELLSINDDKALRIEPKGYNDYY